MRIIAHRGNISGPNPARENSPDYIQEALALGYEVEIDVRLIGGEWFLGHDEPQYKIPFQYLQSTNLWCHVKNSEAFSFFVRRNENTVHYFWHQNDDYAFTSQHFGWVYPGKPLFSGCIAVMPETHYLPEQLEVCDGVCTDYAQIYRDLAFKRS